MDQTYSFKSKGKPGEKDQKPKEVKLDSAHKLTVGDVVSLDEGKRAKITGLTLNVGTGKYDVDVEDTQDAQTRVIDAEGNDPHPERHAVKDVVNDPKYTPAVSDPDRPASENAAILAGGAVTGTVQGPVDATGKKRPAGADIPREQQKARLDAEKAAQGKDTPAPRSVPASEGSKDFSSTAAIRR